MIGPQVCGYYFCAKTAVNSSVAAAVVMLSRVSAAKLRIKFTVD